MWTLIAIARTERARVVRPFIAIALTSGLFACGGSAFSVAATTLPEASSTSDSGTAAPDTSGGELSLVDSSDEEQAALEGSLSEAEVSLVDGSFVGDGPSFADSSSDASAPVHACPSTCAQLNANCGAVADTFCGGLVQCGACTTGVCGGAAPSMCGCPSGKLACGAGCTDPMTDSANCGKCGTSCSATSVQGEACIAGVCGCGAGNVICDGEQANYCLVAYKACF